MTLDVEELPLSEEERLALGEITPERMAADLARYTGVEPIDGSGTRISSRNRDHPDNARAVDALVRDLEGIGSGRLDVRRHTFPDETGYRDNVEAELAGGEVDEVVLVTAHLDSIGGPRDRYNHRKDPAPGADDDGSGTVAVLAIARAFVALSRTKPFKRTVRFVLFNSEGSKRYACDEAILGTPIVAVFQMDMIGYNGRPPPDFELHVGIKIRPDIEELSRPLAERVSQADARGPAAA